MMFAEIVARVREQCPDFAHVDHILTSAATYDLPAALVAPVKVDGERPMVNIIGGYAQGMVLMVGVYVVLDRLQNGPGDEGGADLFDRLCAQLRDALVNWQPSDAVEPIVYAGGQMAPYEQGVVTWREDFSVRYEMRMTP